MANLDKSIYIPILDKGEKLFHYTSAAGFMGICEGEFWVTESNFLNDYTEFKIAKQIFIEVIDENIKNNRIQNIVKDTTLNELERLCHCPYSKEDTTYFGEYVISFCLDRDSSLMWSEYSNFCGYCLEFDFDKLLNSFENPNSFLHGKVIYNHDEQINAIIQTIEKYFFEGTDWKDLNNWEDFVNLNDQQIKDFCDICAVIIIIYNAFFKLSCFSGENEYRFIFSCIHEGGKCLPEQHEKQYFKIKDQVLIPYVIKKLKSLDALNEVLIGPKNNSDLAVIGAERYLRILNLDVSVTKSEIPLRY